MNLTQLRSLARLKVPAATSSVISDDNQLIIFNNATIEIARKTMCLPTYTSISTVADQLRYNLSTLISDFLVPLPNGIYYYDGTDYEPLDIRTRENLDADWSDWLSATSGTPDRCFLEGDVLTLNPPDDAAQTNGLLIYYVKSPPEMSVTNIYPFGGTSLITRLKPYHTLIVDYYEKEVYEILDINDPISTRRSRAENKYLTNLAIMKAEMQQYITEFVVRAPKTRMRTTNSYAENPF